MTDDIWMAAQEASVIFMHIMRALRMYLCISQMPLDLRACRMTKKLVPACLSICILYVCLCFRWNGGKKCWGCSLRVEHIPSLSGMSVDAALLSCLVAHLWPWSSGVWQYLPDTTARTQNAIAGRRRMVLYGVEWIRKLLIQGSRVAALSHLLVVWCFSELRLQSLPISSTRGDCSSLCPMQLGYLFTGTEGTDFIWFCTL